MNRSIALRKKLLPTLIGSVLAAHGAQAYAGSCTHEGGGVFTCAGAAGNDREQALTAGGVGGVLTVTTHPGFGITTDVGYAFKLTGRGGLSFTDANGSTITGSASGIWADNAGGALSITTTGTVSSTGSNSHGIRAVNAVGTAADSTDLTIHVANVAGRTAGIWGTNYGDGTLSITATGTVTGRESTGIRADNSGTDLIIHAADVAGGGTGIRAANVGTGALSITATGTVTGGSANGIYAENSGTDLTIHAADVVGGTDGIYAQNRGTDALSIRSTGTVMGGRVLTGKGIFAENFGTDLIIQAADATGGVGGIDAKNEGSGALSITTTGVVTGGVAVGYGITAVNKGTDLTIHAAKVVGGVSAIRATNEGSDALNITATGTVESGNGFGIYANNSGTDLAIHAADVNSVSGTGIVAINNGTGALDVTATGTVTSDFSGGINAVNHGTGLTIEAATVTGRGEGIAARNNGTGALSISATGTVTGGMGRTGIYASNVGKDLIIDATSVTGGTHGIDAKNEGTGALSISATGTVTGGTGNGIYADNRGTGALSITAAGEVTGAGAGIVATTATSDAFVDIAGRVKGGKGVAIDMRGVTGTATLSLRDGWGLNGQAMGATSGNDVLVLDGAADSELNLADIGDAGRANAILGFEHFIKQGDAAWTLSGAQAGDGFQSAELRAGQLILDDAHLRMAPGASAFTIAERGTLSGAGTVMGHTTVRPGGTLAGQTGETLTINGDLVLDAQANVNVTLGKPNEVDSGLFNVKGDLTLDGKLNVSNLGGFDVGIYRIFDYGGTLTNHGFVLGELPEDFGRDKLSLNFNTAGQVNLLNGEGVTLSLWEGPDPATRNGVLGTDGAWDMKEHHWTDAEGTVKGAWSGGFAVFAGALATVTVDNGAGQVNAEGMQFASDGYVVTGDAIVLTETESVIRVGVGTRAGAAMTGTIHAQLTGDGGLVKTDYGTLVLTADNTYAGDTQVRGGTLVVGTAGSADAALSGSAAVHIAQGAALGGYGSVAGAVTNAGTLAVGDAIGLSEGPAGGADFRIGGGLINSGTVVVAGTGVGNRLTVGGDYVGQGGTFVLNTVLNEGGAATQTDKVVIAGHASGESRIAIHNAGGTGGLTGTDPTDGIQVVEIGGRSEAEFKLSHAVIAGVYDYDLYQADGQNWYLQSKANKDEDGGPGEGKVADSIEGYNLALSAAQQHVQTTLGTFHERLGELRRQDEAAGYQSWFRGIGQGGSYAPRASGHAGRAFDLNTSGFQLGADYSLDGLAGPGDQLTFGAFGDRARSRLDVKRSTANGTLTSKGVGVYAAYQQQAPADSAPGAGFYADAVLKRDWLDLEVKAVSVSQFGIGHAYTGSALTAALETGYGLGLGNGVVVVPNAQLSWSKLDADGFVDDTGVSVHSQHAKSLLGRAGVRLEKTRFLGQGAASDHHKTLAKSVTTFADISAKHEFKGRNGLVANDTVLGSNMGGTRGDVGVGAVVRIGPRVSLFGRAAAEFGGNTTEVSKKASAGVKVAW